MKTVKQTAEYTIFKRNDDRYAIRDNNRKWINGDAKVEILYAEALLKKPEPKAEAPAEEVASEEAAAE